MNDVDVDDDDDDGDGDYVGDMISTTITVNSTETAATTVTDMGLVIMRLRSSWELFSSTVSMAVVAVTMAVNEDAAFGL